MSSPRRVKLLLEIDLVSQPIEGEVSTSAGANLPFVGWLGLSSALDRAAGPGDTVNHPHQEEPHVP